MLYSLVLLSIPDESDREFMKNLYHEHNRLMFRVARLHSASMEDAEDAVSEACLSLIKKISVLRQLDCNILEAYCISTVKNAAFMIHRKRAARREEALDLDPAGIEDLHSVQPDSRLLRRDEFAALQAAIAQLSGEDQTAIRMKYFEHRTDGDIALALGVQKATVRSRLSRARQRIRKAMKEQGHA